MKKFTAIILALILALSALTMVACGGDNYDEHEETPNVTDGGNDGPLDLESQGGAVTAPAADSEDNAYINAAPANDEQGWGELTPRP